REAPGPRGDIPDLHRLINTSRRQRLAVGADRDGHDRSGVPLQRGLFFSGVDVPDSRRVIPAAGNQRLTVTRKRQRADQIGVSVERRAWFSRGGFLPARNGKAANGGQQSETAGPARVPLPRGTLGRAPTAKPTCPAGAGATNHAACRVFKASLERLNADHGAGKRLRDLT